MLSKRLKEARLRNKLTQQGLADKLQTTKGTISNYENGHSTPSNEMLKDLANALEVSTDYLLGRTDNPTGTSSQKSLVNEIPEDLLEFFLDPELQIAFRNMPGDPEEVKKEIIKLLRFIKFNEENRKPGDKQGE